ncbi:MAG: hypothetical protein JWM11_5331 [Planctomycetaceae bacterium]|nr:hypothetical protein [Planctomycetaceae bacterium]
MTWRQRMSSDITHAGLRGLIEVAPPVVQLCKFQLGRAHVKLFEISLPIHLVCPRSEQRGSPVTFKIAINEIRPISGTHRSM